MNSRIQPVKVLSNKLPKIKKPKPKTRRKKRKLKRPKRKFSSEEATIVYIGLNLDRKEY